MNKLIVITSVIFCFLFTVFLTLSQAEEKEQPTSYQYVFKVGSSNFHGVVDGVEGKGELLYPVIIDGISSRSGVDFRSCFSFIPITTEIQTLINYISPSKDTMIIIGTKSKDTELVFQYPSQKVYLDNQEILNEFPVQYITEGINTNAYWNKKKIHHNNTYLIPLRLVFEFTGHKVDWNPDTQEITVTYPAPETEE